MRNEKSLSLALELVRVRGRCSRRWLQDALEVDDSSLDEICRELVERRGVVTEDDGELCWQDALAQHDSSQGWTPSAERRLVTFLFCDLNGSTALSSELDVEDLRDLIVEYLNTAGSVVEMQGGTVARYLGDGILAYFGWPNTNEDDAVRAVSAGLQIVERVAQLAQGPQPRLSVRVGLHTGPAIIGEFGSGNLREALATGPTPNIGARIEAIAEPGTVCISEVTETLVRSCFELEDRGPFTLKGVDHSVGVFRVVRERTGRGRLACDGGAGTLLGRGDSLDRLADALQRTERKTCVAIAVYGEAGIGKSRLLHEFRSVSKAQALVIETQCNRLERQSSLQAVAQALSSWLGAQGSLQLALQEAVSACAGLDSGPAIALLAALLRVDLPAARRASIEDWTPRRRRSVLFDAMAAIVLGQARRQPVLFLIEDAHWADPSTLEWLALLHDRATGHALMIVLTARPEFRDTLPRFERMFLEPLGDESVRGLVAAVAGNQAVPAHLADRVCQRSGGNPLFAQELTRHLLAGHASSPGTASVEPRAPPIPATLQGVLTSHLDRVGAAKHLVQVAAMIGLRFDIGLLQAVARVDASTLNAQLGALAEAQVLEPIDASNWTFRHVRLQDAATQMLLRKAQRDINSRIAHVLVTKSESIPPERIAHHFTEAGEAAEAVQWWSRAGMASLRRFAAAEAEAHFGRALEVHGTLPASNRDLGVELMLRTQYAVPLTLSRGWASDEVALQYRRAEVLCQQVVDSGEVLPTRIGLQTYLIVSGRPREAQRMAQDTLEASRRTGDPAIVLEAELDCGAILFYLGAFRRSIGHMGRVEDLYVPARDHAHVDRYGKDPLVVALVHKAMALACGGQLDEAVLTAERAVEHSMAWPHPFSHLWALLGVASVRTIREEFAAAGEVAAHVAAAARELGYPNWEAQAMTYQGLGLAAIGRHDEGIHLIESGLEQWRATGAQVAVPSMMSFLQRALQLAGHAERACEVAEDILAWIDRTEEAWTHANALRLYGEAVQRRDGDVGAEPWFRRALARASDMQVATWELCAATGLAGILQRRGARDEARSVLGCRLEACVGGQGTPPVLAARRMWAALERC